MKTASTIVFTLAAAVALPLVAAHGIVQDMTIDGKFFRGNRVGGPSEPSGIRQVFSPEPIKGAKNRDINCGVNAKPASLVLDANPGSKLTFNWRGADGSKWPHNTGPIMTYLASCGELSCDKFDPINAKWFKIEQDGRKPNGNWVQQDLMDGGVAEATLPNNLAPGNYLVRHEIIALHLAPQRGGAEFYAACAQLRVGGSETGVPDPSDLVALPGAYSDNDPGIFVPDVFDTNAKYVYPGPPVAKLVAGKPDSTTSSPEPSATADGSSCRLNSQARSNANRPRQLSRVMRPLRIH